MGRVLLWCFLSGQGDIRDVKPGGKASASNVLVWVASEEKLETQAQFDLRSLLIYGRWRTSFGILRNEV